MRSLLSKELYQLKPIAWLLIALTLLSVVETVWTKRIDEYRFSAWCEEFCRSGTPIDYGIAMMIIVMIVAYSLFPTEHDESTIDFLHALPVSRASIFVGKVLAGMLVLLLLICVDYAVSALLLSANPQSLDGKFYPGFFAPQMLLEAVFAFVILSHGLFVSWFRWLGLMIYVVYLIALMAMEISLGGAGLVSVFSMLQITIDGQSLQLAWRNIAVHCLVALALLYVSYLLWSRDHRVRDSALGGRRGRWLSVLGAIALFAFAAAAMIYQSSLSLLGDSSAELESYSTKHYRFVAAKDTHERLTSIMQHADADYQTLIAMLSMQQQPTIQADMTSANEHALGVASWKKVRMNISGFESDREYRRILSHETTHALQSVESDRKLGAHYNASKFFIEGMAQYTSFTIVPNAALRNSNWRLAAIAWSRQGIEFSDVIDFNNFQQSFDENLVYTLGDIWAQALVDTCDERVLGDFLRVLKSESLPGLLPGREFWRRSLAQSDCQLEGVIDNWQSQLRTILAANNPADFPLYGEPLILADSKTNKIRVRATLEPFEKNSVLSELPEKYHLKIRSDTQLGQSPDSLYYGRLLSDEQKPIVEFLIPASVARRNKIEYQLGYVPDGGRRSYFERWRRGTVRSE